MDGTRAIRVAPAAFLCATADLWGGCPSRVDPGLVVATGSRRLRSPRGFLRSAIRAVPVADPPKVDRVKTGGR